MTHENLAHELALKTPFVSIKRINEKTGYSPVTKGCTLRILKNVFAGEKVVLTLDLVSCNGGKLGFGFKDPSPEMLENIKYFVSCGRGEGFPPGERFKHSPEDVEAMFQMQPKAVLENCNAIEFKPYETGDTPELVLTLVNADQLAALATLFTYRNPALDAVIMTMCSGCASVARLPFGELRNATSRAIIGNCDIVSRNHFDAETFFFTIPAAEFAGMLADADGSFIGAPAFNGIRKRLIK
ncbi:MAG: DUF169 domain-containing protein [Treponema sp.]|jgi:uncharacterized protein (DUF169 family)|nr:DUF169 domain-containing protein [Treponema sp.]